MERLWESHVSVTPDTTPNPSEESTDDKGVGVSQNGVHLIGGTLIRTVSARDGVSSRNVGKEGDDDRNGIVSVVTVTVGSKSSQAKWFVPGAQMVPS